MESRFKLFGHPVHPMLIVFPLGLLATAVIFDLIWFGTSDGLWTTVSFYMIAAGVIGGLIAAIPGVIDFLAIPPGTRAKRIGLLHGIGNVIVVLMFAGSWVLRTSDVAKPGTGALFLSFAAVILALVTGWLGGELVDRLGIGVDEGANLDAPSSLKASKIDTTKQQPRRAA